MKINLYPSIMCAKPWELKQYIQLCEENNIAAIHFDVMDGHFVKNITLGVCEFNAIRELTKLPIDMHLMCNDPEIFLDYFNLQPGDTVSFHPEACKDPIALLKKIKEKGCKAGLAISPDTTTDYIEQALDLLDIVLVLAVYPGFAGQKMVPTHLDKLSKIKDICAKASQPIEISVDGNTTAENTVKMTAHGATGIVAGSSALFKGGPDNFKTNLDNYLKESGCELV